LLHVTATACRSDRTPDQRRRRSIWQFGLARRIQPCPPVSAWPRIVSATSAHRPSLDDNLWVIHIELICKLASWSAREIAAAIFATTC